MTMVERQQTPAGGKPLTGRGVLMWVIGFFAVIFAANGVFIYLALGSFPGVVVDSSYKASQAYNKELATARAQAERGWTVTASLERGENDQARLRIEPRDKEGLVLTGLTLTASLEHPAHQGQDLTLDLQETQSGVYEGSAEGLTSGNWELVIEARQGEERLFRSQNRVFLAQ
ncbi:FixH family protein [Roseibium aestuarii]|uniref:FixH family protein n=1 Tax=Roseibium aestuarii TaxID=2600299 RepID=A0ABW4JTW3_9HYPH|nr:FixH family protein [Roseibium aestuarii]